jgi:hypothetical protein
MCMLIRLNLRIPCTIQRYTNVRGTFYETTIFEYEIYQ